MANTVVGFDGNSPPKLLEVIGSFPSASVIKVTISGTTTSEDVVIPSLSTIRGAVVTVLDSGNNVATSDIDVTWSGNTLTLADGASFNLDASGHAIYAVVWGSART
ncbi:MAG: hypothetical protein ACE5IR_27770 [bacterium]